MDKITDDIAERLTKTLEAGISEQTMVTVKKQVRDLLYEIETDIDYRLKEDLAPNLTAFVEDMAKKTVNAILEGNQQQMERYLGCESGHWTGRHADQPAFLGQRRIEEWHSVIRGRLFEQGAIALRKAIVVAHRDLIESQRILDLEDQVASLVAQNNKLQAALERKREDERYA